MPAPVLYIVKGTDVLLPHAARVADIEVGLVEMMGAPIPLPFKQMDVSRSLFSICNVAV